MSTPARRLLITGATGKQGGSLIRALLAHQASTPPFHLLALTRDASSPRAQSLAKTPNVSIIQGDLNDVPSIFRKATNDGKDPLYGVFSVQTPLKPKVEEAQGKALVDAAVTAGVKQFVYASVERGGEEKSNRDPTEIKHFISKFNVEEHLKKSAAAKSGSMQWTIIRPVFFMDNFTDDFLGRAVAAIWKLNGMDTKLQMVSSRDIGILAAEAFRNPQEYAGKAISFATDELTPREANEIFKRVAGREMPSTYPVVAKGIKTVLREQLGVMFDWFKETGFGAEPREFTDKFPEMQNLERWLAESSDFRKK